jgi:hypothetical protein
MSTFNGFSCTLEQADNKNAIKRKYEIKRIDFISNVCFEAILY